MLAVGRCATGRPERAIGRRKAPIGRYAIVLWSLQARRADLQGVARSTIYSPKGDLPTLNPKH